MKKSKKGFTLIELLVVITIIGILASIVITNMAGVTDKAEIQAATANLNSFYKEMTIANVKAMPSPADLKEQTPAGFAAWFRKRADFITNEFWYVESAEDVIAIVEDEDKGGIPTGPAGIAKSDGTFATDLSKEQKDAMSYCIAVPTSDAKKKNLRTLKNGGNFPILWTKGLGTDGEWVGESPWGGKGGHVLYSNGDIKWYEDVKGPDSKGVFADSETEEKTFNIKDALPDNWDILTPDGSSI